MTAISALGSLTTPAGSDLMVIVDSSDTTMAATGTDKQITARNLLGYVIVQPSGDTTGAADSAAINAALTGLPRPLAVLGPGTFYINAPITPQNNTWLQGSGMQSTTIQQGSGFASTAMIQAAVSSTVSDLTFKAPSTTTASNAQADAVSITQQGGYVAGVTVRNVQFTNINGWCVNFTDTGTFGAPVNCLFENLYDGGGNSGGLAIFGAQRTVAADLRNIHLNASGGTSTTLDAMLFQDVFDVEVDGFYLGGEFGSGGNTGYALHLSGHISNARFIHSEIGSGAACVRIEDNINGHASQITFADCTFQTSTIGVDLQGACSDILFDACNFNTNTTHGVVVNSSGALIRFRGCTWNSSGGSNGAGAAGTNYDLNWSGTATGDVSDCLFHSAITAVGVAGVQASVNVAAGQQVVFTGAEFTGNSQSSSNWFTNTPSGAMVISGGVYNFVSGLTVASTSGAWQPSDSSLVSWTFDPVGAGQNTFQLGTAGTGYGAAFKVGSAAAISTLYMVLQTAGVTLTASQCFVAVFNSSGTLLGSASTNSAATDLATVWAGATGLITCTLTVASGQSLTLPAGKYWACAFFNGTTGPKLFSAAPSPYFTAVNAGITGSSSRAATLFTGATTAVPTSATFTAGGEALWFGIK